MEESQTKKRSKSNQGFKKVESKKNKQIQEQIQEPQQLTQSKTEPELKKSNLFTPKSSLIQEQIKKTQQTEKNDKNDNSSLFESVLKQQKNKDLQQSQTRSTSSGAKAGTGKKSFMLNKKKGKKIESEQLKQAEEIMKNPELRSKKMSQEVEQEIGLEELEQNWYNGMLKPKSNIKKNYNRTQKGTNIIDTKRDIGNDEDNDLDEEYQSDNDVDTMVQNNIKQKYGQLFEPNVFPFKMPEEIENKKKKSADMEIEEEIKENKEKQKKECSIFEEMKREEYSLVQFPAKYLFDLPANAEKMRIRRQNINRKNLGDNKEILNLDVQNKFDSAGNKIIPYNGDIDHFIANWDQLKKEGSVGYSIGKLAVTKSGKSKFIAGDNEFMVDKGISNNCLQELHLVSQSEQTLFKVANIKEKYVFKPDIFQLYNA